MRFLGAGGKMSYTGGEKGAANLYVGGGGYYEWENLSATADVRYSYYQISDDDWIDVACSMEGNVGIKSDGTLWAWGTNGGETRGWATDGWGANALGLGVNNHIQPTFAQVGTADNWTNVWASQHASFALRDDGTLWVSGDGYAGQRGLGLATTTVVSEFTQIGTANNWTDIFSTNGAFNNTALAVNSDGELYGWGVNNYGQLGQGNVLSGGNNYSIPTSLTGSTGWTQVFTNGYSSFAIKNGTLYGCGRNQAGQLGLGDTTDRTTWTEITGPNVTDVSTATYTTYFTKSDGTLWGMGDAGGPNSNQAYLIYGNFTDQTSPVQVGSDTDWTGFAKGSNYYYGVVSIKAKKTNGSIYGMFSNSLYNTYANLSFQHDYETYFYRVTGLENNSTGFSLIGGYPDGSTSFSADITKIQSGGFQGMIIKGGKLWACGSNANYSFGSAGTTYELKLKNSDNDWEKILNAYDWSNGGLNLFLTKKDGTLWAVGLATPANAYNNFGNNMTTTNSTTTGRTVYHEPTQISTDTHWNDILSMAIERFYATLYVKSDGTLWYAGQGSVNPLANLGNTKVWTQVGSDTDWEWVSGYLASFYARKGGVLYSWGENSNGQLGLGDYVDKYYTLTQVDSNDWTKVSVGQNYSLGLRSNGTLWATGQGQYGKTGLGNETNVNTFTQIGTSTDWVDIATSVYTSLAINSSGELWWWGAYTNVINSSNNSANHTPGKVNNDTDWARLFITQPGTLYASKTDGTVWVIRAWIPGTPGVSALTDDEREDNPYSSGTWLPSLAPSIGTLPTTPTKAATFGYASLVVIK